MTKDKALKLALEALEEFGEHYDWCHQFPTYAFPENYPPCNCGYDEAINAIKEALAQPEHEWVRGECVKCGQSMERPEQEPVATDWERIARVQDAKLRAMCNEAGGFEKLCEVMDKYERTIPPQRKPLTDEEINEFFQGMEPNNGFWLSFARAIEAAHGIKGEA